VEISFNIVHYGRPATPPITDTTGHVLGKLAFAIDDRQSAIGKL
jgi:hypothetical protein